MRVLYISTNFAALSHTFITREIHQLRQLGLTVDLLSLRTPGTSPATAPECDLSGCHFAYPASPLKVIDGVLRALFFHPDRLWRAIWAILNSRGDSVRSKLKLLYQLAVASPFAPLIEKSGVEHIHAHFAGSPASFALFLHLLTELPFTFTDHGAGLYHDRVGLDPKFRHAAGISAISRYNVEYYKRFTDTPPPSKIIRCGLDLTKFVYRQRESLGDPVQIVSVSRLVPKKGYSDLLAALRDLKARGINWRCRIVGEGPLLPSLQEQAREMGLDELTFTGPMQQDEIRKLLEEADLFPLPCVVAPDGDIDGIPVTLMEAMACGCPTLSTRVTGIPELVINEETGMLVEPGDVTALTDAMARLVAEPMLVAKISAGGRRWVEEEFNIVRSARRQRDFFMELAGGKTES